MRASAALATMAVSLALLVGASIAAAPSSAEALTITRCADFNRDGVVSLAEVDEEVSYFGTYLLGPANDAGRSYELRHDLQIAHAPHQTLAQTFHIDIGDILVAVRQYAEGC